MRLDVITVPVAYFINSVGGIRAMLTCAKSLPEDPCAGELGAQKLSLLFSEEHTQVATISDSIGSDHRFRCLLRTSAREHQSNAHVQPGALGLPKSSDYSIPGTKKTMVRLSLFLHSFEATFLTPCPGGAPLVSRCFLHTPKNPPPTMRSPTLGLQTIDQRSFEGRSPATS